MKRNSISNGPALMTGVILPRRPWLLCLLCLLCLCAAIPIRAATPPVTRSTSYNGAYSNIVSYAVQPWMNTNTVLLTVESWIYCADLLGDQAIIARNYRTNLYFGVSGNKLRLYRSGGTSVDSTGTVPLRRWTHVAVTYDGVNARFFLNGTLDATRPLASAGNNCTNVLSLGGQRDLSSLGDALAGGYAFNGYLDEVRIWSVVRSASAIAANMNAELRSGTGLLAAFGSGGDFDDLRLVRGATQGIPAADRMSGFGILPATLCIPYTRNVLKVDGTIDLLNEYRGAETMVLRSSRSAGAQDRQAYLMISTNSTNDHLFVAVPDLETAGAPQIPVVQLMCDVNPAGGTNLGLGDWQCSLAQDGFQGGSIFGTQPPFFPTPQWLSWGQSAVNWQAATLASTEFNANYEFRIHSSHLNHFTNGVRLLARYYSYSASGDEIVAPLNGVPDLPATFENANWCGEADGSVTPVRVRGVVTNVVSRLNESGWFVSLISGASALGGQVILSTPVNASGGFDFTASVPDDLPYHVELGVKADYTILPPRFTPGTGRVPSTMTANRTLTFSACSGSGCSPAFLRFEVQPPPGPVSITGLSQSSGAPEVVLRDAPRKVLPGSVITLSGANLHTRFQVYLSKCSSIPPSPSFCTVGSDLFLVPILSNDVAQTALTVQLPADSPAFSGAMQWVLKDLWPSHPGWRDITVGPGFSVDRNLHPYAQLHGFEFYNEGNGPSLEEFESVYGNNIFSPFPPFRDPYYYAIWWPIYYGLGEGFRSGSCHGMAAASRLFSRGLLRVSDYDVPGSGGPNGVHYAAGFPSAPGGHPIQPADWTGFDFVQPFRPVDVWAVIRTYMMAQYSEESFANTLSQLNYGNNLDGDPVGVYNRVRVNPANYVLCFNPGGIGGGHCITPYGTLDNFKLNEADLTQIVPDPNFSVIKVYDNNWPGQERYLEINRVGNYYRYPLDGDTTWSSRSIFTTPISLFTGSRHAPGAATFASADFGTFIRYLIGGQADAQHTDAGGGSWGWNGAGAFADTYPGARSIFPLFGFSTNRDVRSAVAFLPRTNAPAKTTIHARGSNYVFHAGSEGTTFQLVVSNRFGGGDDLASLVLSNQSPTGLRFTPGKPLGSLTPMVSETGAGLSTVYILIGLNLPSAHEIELRSDKARHGVALFNRGGAPLSYALEMLVGDVGGMIVSNRYGPFNTPAGAGQFMSFPSWPSTSQVLSELDLGLNGTIDQTGFLLAERALAIHESGTQLILTWVSSRNNDILETSDKLGPEAKWGIVSVSPQINGNQKTVTLLAGSAPRYFRLRP